MQATLALLLAAGLALAGPAITAEPPALGLPSDPGAEPAPAAESAGEPAPEESAPEPRRRPRRRPRYPHLSKPKPPRVHLKAPAWTPQVRAALQTLIMSRDDQNKSYDPDWPPVAVLALDDVSVVHHAGEAAFQRLVERAEFKFDKDWWKLVPAAHRGAAERAQRAFSGVSETVWLKDADYGLWRKAMFASYDEMCREQGRRRCRAWLSQLLTGFTEAEVEAYMRDVIEEALREPLATAMVHGHAGDEKPVPTRRGLRRIVEITELVGELLRGGFDVWMLSSSNQWSAEALARRYGVDPSRVVGIRSKVLNKRLVPEVVDPIPEGVGKAEAVTLNINRDPALIIAGSAEPELLEYGKGLRVAIDRGDEKFAARAKAKGWLLQPALPPAPPESLP